MRRLFSRLAARLRLGRAALVQVVLCGTRRIRRLKREQFGIDQTTDCVAFGVDRRELRGGVRYLGEVFLCPAVVARNARALRRAFDEEMIFVFVHGLLHLLGYTDETADGRRRMFAKQESLIRSCWDGATIFTPTRPSGPRSIPSR